MKALAINASPRKTGNTATLLQTVLDEIAVAGIATELIHIGGQAIHGCTGCRKCGENKNQRCVIANDCINDTIAKMIDADAIILGSPTYFADVSTEMKALIDRAGYVTLANGGLLTRKIGAAVAAVRRGGSTHAIDTMIHLFGICQMINVGSSYWNMGFGNKPGEVTQDAEGIETMKNLGRNIAWLMKSIDVAKASVPAPDTAKRTMTSFIR